MSENYNFSESGEGADIPHAFRYYVARGFIEPGDTVIDAACGWGKGTDILSRSMAQSVVGIDYRDDCMEFVKKYDLTFKQLDLNECDLPPCDYFVTIETIEHLKDPQKFADMQKASTKHRIFVTTPIIETKAGNEHHLHDFTTVDVISLYQDEEWKLFHHAVHGGIYGMFLFTRR